MRETYTGRQKGRILIVDDELVVRDSLQKWFDSEGYETGAVASGREALTAIQKTQWDLALLDIKMPGMDGMELAEETARGRSRADRDHHDRLRLGGNRGRRP